MNVRSASQQMAGPIGEELAHADDLVQAELIDAFAREAWMAWGSSDLGRDYQMCAIARHLGPKARWLVKGLAEFIELDDEEPT